MSASLTIRSTRWRQLIKHVGSKAELARQLETSEVQLWRWGNGLCKPREATMRRAINRICRKHGIQAVYPSDLPPSQKPTRKTRKLRTARATLAKAETALDAAPAEVVGDS